MSEEQRQDIPRADRDSWRQPSSGATGPEGVSTREAAAALGVSERTIRRAIASGELAAVKGEWAYRIDPESLDRFAARTPKSPGPRPLARIVEFPGGADVTHLPEPLSSFVGRSADVAAVQALLDDDASRLITLTGPGGIGKTRLALAVAGAVVRDRFADGVAFVPLADLHGPEMVLPAIAQALGLRDRPGSDQGEQIRAFLRKKRLLLVLDNFEHLLPAAPDVGALLADAPAVTALVTSRSPLRVTGEREVAVQPMTVAAGAATAAGVLASDAGRLFIERAREHDASFDVDEDAAPLIAGICARLDGLPLAIELAAARIKVLPPHQLHARLERRLPLLTRGPRNAPSRHSTMRDAIAWSYDTLSPSHQRCFQRLAVFSGGATLEAAEYVGGDGLTAPPPSVLDLIADLTDQALLTSETGLDGERRFRMLETIREFGLEQLAAAYEEHETRTLHAQYFLGLSRRLRPLASTHASTAPYVTLAAEYPNLQEVLIWLDERGPAGDFVELVADLCEFWYASSFGREADAWLARAVAKLDHAAPLDQGRLLVGNAGVLLEQGDFAGAEPLLARGLELLRAAGDPLFLSRALIFSGSVLSVQGGFVEAEAPLLEALALAEQIADPDLRAAADGRALTNLCCAARGQGDVTRAMAYGEESLRLYVGKPFDPVKAMALIDLGSVANDAGNHEHALARLREGIALMGERGDMRQVADALSGIACIATAWNEPQTALLLFGAADALRERVGAAMVWPADIAAVERSFAALRATLDEQAIVDTLAAGRALPLTEAFTLASALTPPHSARSANATRAVDALTNRERDVLRLLAQHQTDREIAETLFLGLRTVNWHVRSILAKLGASSRREAVIRARADGLV